MSRINASIVLYHNKKEQLTKAINSFLHTDLEVKLYLVDNSSDDTLKELSKKDNRIDYIFNNANLGYGSAHNIAIQKSIDDGVTYHLVLNPDVSFEKGTIKALFDYMEHHNDVGFVMPKVVYPNGDLQYLCKIIPTPMDLFGRRFLQKSLNSKSKNKLELRFTGYNAEMEVPWLSGCFMFLRVSILKEVGLFDERFFMYMEDLDLSRRIHEKYKTVYYPSETIVHEHAKDSYKSFKMLQVHIKSAVKYFNKWGWVFDKKRKATNNKILKRLGYIK